MTRAEALAIVNEYVKNQNLVKHMLAVEAAMAAYAKKLGEDEETYRVAGLLHDFDWEIHPRLPDHPLKGVNILRQKGADEELIRVILSHANHTGVKRVKLIDKVLYACDELTGLIVAVALVRPTRSLADVDVEAIKKKFPQPAFAKGVNRQEVEEGAAALGVDLWQEHVPLVLKAMKGIAPQLGLA
jgi:putative nucleotidyltransferase with HDIG domain